MPSKSSVLNAFSRLKLVDKSSKAAAGTSNPFGILDETHGTVSRSAAAYTNSGHYGTIPQPSNTSVVANQTGDQTVHDPADLTNPAPWVTVEKTKPNVSSRYAQPSIPATKSIFRAPVNHLTSKNWRERDPEALKARYEEARTICKTHDTYKSRKTRMTHVPGPRTVGGVLFADQTPGAIFWHWDMRTKKGRYFIIVHVEGETVAEVAIYTNGNNGLRSVKSKRWKEYFSLRPKHISPKEFSDCSPENQVLDVKWMHDNKDHIEGKLVRSTMIVNWTEVRDREIDTANLRLVGALSEESTKILCGKALRPL